MTQQFTAAYPSIYDIKAYQTGKPIDELAREIGIAEESIVKLASNENPLGCSPKVAQVVTETLQDASRYPDGGGYYLKQAIIKHHDGEYPLTHENITLGNGSNDLLDLITRTFVSNTDSTVFSQYAFIVYWLATKSVGAEAVVVPAKDYGHDLQELANQVKENTKVVFLANPNNPTGSYFEHAELVSFLQSVPKHVLVVLDEAYVEYFEPSEYVSSVSLLKDFENLIVTRTFSKAYGLASMRVGYAISSAEVAGLLNRIRQPFNVNSLAQAAGIASLADKDFVLQSRELNNTEMKKLEAVFSELKLEFIPSKANFITVKVGDSDTAGVELYEKLLQKGVITRPLAGYGLGEWLRISIGTQQENAVFVETLKEVLA